MGKKAYLKKKTKSTVYFLENFTPQNKKLRWMMRADTEKKGYQFVWQKNKKSVLKSHGERAISIVCEVYLDKIC